MFEFGCVVVWGLTEEHDKELLRLCQIFEKEPVKSVEMDTFRSSRGVDTIIEGEHALLVPCFASLTFSRPDDGLVVLEIGERAPMARVVISHAMAQSVKV